VTLRLRINHAGSPARITPLDGVPPLPKRKADGATKNRKPVESAPPRRNGPRLPRSGR